MGAGRLVNRVCLACHGARLAGDMRQIEEQNSRMREWLIGDCNCPCCEQDQHCLDGCTFANDSPAGAERMAGARKAVFGI